jgi:hypothetical protein
MAVHETRAWLTLAHRQSRSGAARGLLAVWLQLAMRPETGRGQVTGRRRPRRQPVGPRPGRAVWHLPWPGVGSVAVSDRELVVLGTASRAPTRSRNHNGYLLLWDGEGLLFDPGGGTQFIMDTWLYDAALELADGADMVVCKSTLRRHRSQAGPPVRAPGRRVPRSHPGRIAGAVCLLISPKLRVSPNATSRTTASSSPRKQRPRSAGQSRWLMIWTGSRYHPGIPRPLSRPAPDPTIAWVNSAANANARLAPDRSGTEKRQGVVGPSL